MITADTIRQGLQCGEPRCPCGQTRGNVHCPAHQDNNPSLSVTETADGKVLVHCHAGCTPEAVLEALKVKGLWLTPAREERPPARPRGGGQAPPGRIVQTYDYRNPGGKLVFQVVRLDPKSFRQRRPDGAGRWVWSLKGVEPIPYRLPELLAADPGAWVFVTEGEKDADALAALGLVATTNPGGAGKWRPNYTEHLVGRRVAILPDNDPSGKAHAHQVAQALHGVAAVVKVVDLPDLPPKGDSSDFLKGGGTRYQLLHLAEQAPEWRPITDTETGIPLFPEEVMTGAAGRFAQVFGEYLETPPQFLFMSYLTHLAHMICNQVTLDSELSPQPRLYTILVGASADVRKSTSIDKTAEFFLKSIEPSDRNIIHGVSSAEGLMKCFKKNNRLLILQDELRSIVQKMKIDTSVLLPCIGTLFTSNRYDTITQKHDIRIDDAYLCILAASTLDTYANMFTSQFIDIGFINRLFLVLGDGKRKFSVPSNIPQEIIKKLQKELANTLGFSHTLSKHGLYRMPIEIDALKLFDDWYFTLEHSVFAKRLDAFGHRLMILLALNSLKQSIDRTVMKHTISLLQYQLQARRYADPVDADNLQAQVEEKIRRALRSGPLKKRDLERRVHKARVGVFIWNHSINNLLQEREVTFDRRTGIYQLSPHLSPGER